MSQWGIAGHNDTDADFPYYERCDNWCERDIQVCRKWCEVEQNYPCRYVKVNFSYPYRYAKTDRVSCAGTVCEDQCS